MSSLTIEASLYIHFVLYERFASNDFPNKPIKFLDYFYPLMVDKTRKKKDDDPPKYQIDPDYAQLRGNRRLYNQSHRGNLYIQQSQLYTTAFINNFTLHAFSAIAAIPQSLRKGPADSERNTTLFVHCRSQKKNFTANKNLLEIMKSVLQYRG